MSKDLIELLLELLIKALKKLSMGALIGFSLLNLAGCVEAESQAKAADEAPGAPAPPASVPEVVTLKTGAGFECLKRGDGREIYCRKTGSPDARLGITSNLFTLYVASDDAFVSFETWDDTICVSANVDDRPWDNTSGLATYCFGDASLGFNYFTYPIVYSGPPYSHALHGSPDLTYATLPFSGGNHSMDVMTNTGGVWLVMMDSSLLVSSSTLNCNLSGTTLSCPSFNVEVQ